MATSEVEGVLDEWAAAWSAHNTEKILALYTDDCVHEDVTFGVGQRAAFLPSNRVPEVHGVSLVTHKSPSVGGEGYRSD